MARPAQELGADADVRARAEGRDISLEAALAVARQVLTVEVPADRPGGAPGGTGDERLLTLREQEVVPLLAAGLTNQEIADLPFIGRGTVRTHVSNILAKLGARTRTEAAAMACDHGLIDP